MRGKLQLEAISRKAQVIFTVFEFALKTVFFLGFFSLTLLYFSALISFAIFAITSKFYLILISILILMLAELTCFRRSPGFWVLPGKKKHIPKANPSGRNLLRLRSAAVYKKSLIWLCYPGPLMVLVGFLLAPISSSNHFFRDVIMCTMLLLPLLITRLMVQRHEKLDINYYLTELGVSSASDLSKENFIDWDKVEGIKVGRAPNFKEAEYDEDDPDSHQLEVFSADGSKILIPLKLVKMSVRKRFSEILINHLKPGVKDSRDAMLLRKWFEQGSETSESREQKIPSFTEVWNADLQAHIARTNYVPLQLNQALQENRYSITGYLRSGGFCTTYSATDKRRSRVVIKESAFPAGLPEDARQKLAELFEREARLIQRCDHPRIVRVLDFFQEQNREYLVLERIEGVTIATVLSNLYSGHGEQCHRTLGLSDQKVSEAQVLKWAVEMAEILQYLHALEPPIIHRDFTPDNLILHTSGQIHLIDFGAANEFIGNATGTLIGKQSYIAPEQFQGKATPQSDIYSLCASIYFMLTGKDPLPLSESHPRSLRSDISEALDRLVARGTNLDRSQRIQSADELLTELRVIGTVEV